MKIISSDHHVDKGKGPFNRAAFLAFLKWVFGNGYILILNGDFLECWADTLEEILNGPNADIVRMIIDHPEVIIIKGNHDPDLKTMAKLFRRPIYTVLEIDGHRILHGDRLDPALDTDVEQETVKWGDRFFEWANNSWLNKIRNWVAKGDRKNEPLIASLQDQHKSNPAMKWLVAHSHIPLNLGWYINSGCWCDTPDTMAFIMFDKGVAKLYSWPLMAEIKESAE
jgi:UDP-2,3-diacylglucosamine pyrophosphatase LpxH